MISFLALRSTTFSFLTLLTLGMTGMVAMPVLADDALSAPQAGAQPRLANPTPSSANTNQTAEPADVVDQNGDLIVPTSGKSNPVATVTPTPSSHNTSQYLPKKTETSPSRPTPTPTPQRRTSNSKKGDPSVTTIPNPAWGDKVIFRVMTSGPAKARIVVYDRFFNKVADLSGEGEQLFDILWSLKNVSEGLYDYQVEIVDKATGQSRILPMQNFAVMKDESPGNDR